MRVSVVSSMYLYVVSVSYDVLCVVFIFCRFTLALCMFIFIFTSAEHWWLRANHLLQE